MFWPGRQLRAGERLRSPRLARVDDWWMAYLAARVVRDAIWDASDERFRQGWRDA